MDEQLPGGLGHVQIVLKEFVDRRQRLLVKIIRALPAKDLLDEHLAERYRQLIDQTSDAELAVRDDIPLGKKDLAHVERHLCLLVRAADLLDLLDICAVGDVYVPDALLDKAVLDRPCILVDVAVRLIVRDLLDDDHIVLIDRGHKISAVLPEILPDLLKDIRVLSILGFHDQNGTFHISLYMKLFGTAVDIHQQQIVKQEIFDEIVLVKALLVGHHQILQLECRHLSHHVCILTRITGDQDILKLLVIIDLKELAALDLLAVGG